MSLGNISHTIEHLMCQALAQQKQLTISLSVSLDGPDSQKKPYFNEIDEIFLNHAANQS